MHLVPSLRLFDLYHIEKVDTNIKSAGMVVLLFEFFFSSTEFLRQTVKSIDDEKVILSRKRWKLCFWKPGDEAMVFMS